MINRIVDYEVTGAAGVKDGIISVFGTRVVEVWGGECSCVKGSPEDGFAFPICTLMDYSIVDIEVADVLGDVWPLIRTNEGEGVMAGIAGVVMHPLAPWVVSVPFALSLSGGMSHPSWVSSTAEESGWGIVNGFFIFLLCVWFNDVSEDGDVTEV